MPVELAVFITSRVARGLAYAHAKTDDSGKTLGIVHRDVSFKNIMIAFAGDVKLTDFGIAKARGFLPGQRRGSGGRQGRLHEPGAGRFPDHRQTVGSCFPPAWCWATCCWATISSRDRNADESRERIMTMPLPNFSQINPSIDERLNEIFHRTLARDLAKRYATADELLYDLEYYIYHKGYGPTNETLGKFMREIFGQTVPQTPMTKGKTTVVERPGRPPRGWTNRAARATAREQT